MKTDALERLRELRARREACVQYRTPNDLPPDWRAEWGERAAIREFDGGQHREHAEAEAFGEILARMQAADSLDQ